MLHYILVHGKSCEFWGNLESEYVGSFIAEISSIGSLNIKLSGCHSDNFGQPEILHNNYVLLFFGPKKSAQKIFSRSSHITYHWKRNFTQNKKI